MKKTSKKPCVIENNINVVCADKCQPKRLNPCAKRRKPIKKNVKQFIKKVRKVVKVTPRVKVSAPIVEITTPPPVVNITPEDIYAAELRTQLLRFLGNTIEVIDMGGAGAGTQSLNRVGVLEDVGEGTLTIRPTQDNEEQIVIYSISRIIGFRPAVAVPIPTADTTAVDTTAVDTTA